jgi:hypothetical protein
MKRIFVLFSGVAVTLLFSAVPLIAGERVMGKTMEPGQSVEKDECLLIARNCSGQVDSIQERISRLQAEISRGTDVYSKTELRELNKKLDDEYKFLDFMMNSE